MALLQVDFFSEVLGMCTQMNVILPENAYGQIGMASGGANEKWKVMYLLHGLSDDHTIWERRTSIERYVAGKPLAVIMPTTHRGWYTDMHCGFKWYTYITEELPAVCKSFFPNISDRREDTFVCGLSMGGYGAFKLALSKPEQYGWAASLSGALDVAELAEKHDLDERSYFSDVFGPTDTIRGSKNDLFTLAKQIPEDKMPNLYLCCGMQDGLYWLSVRMRNLLKSLNAPVRYEEEDGVHSWEYWDAKIQRVLEWLPLGREEA